MSSRLNFAEPQAEGLNVAENDLSTLTYFKDLGVGGPPQSIRKKGWHRAHKAKKLWAYVPLRDYERALRTRKYAKVIPCIYLPDDLCLVVWPHLNPSQS